MVITWTVGVFLLAVLTSYTLVGLAARHGKSLGMLDVPRAGEVQVKAVPRNGGDGMVVAPLASAGPGGFSPPPGVPGPPRAGREVGGGVGGRPPVVPLA